MSPTDPPAASTAPPAAPAAAPAAPAAPAAFAELSDPAAFVRAQTRLIPAQFVPEVVMHTADEVFELWDRTERESHRTNPPPPFWARPWAGGQALARFVLDRPECVAGRAVLDMASGSGLVAIAALRAGARTVTVSEIDPLALAAIALNADANHVVLTGPPLGDVLDAAPPPGTEVLLIGDAFYERTLAARMLAFARRAHASGATVLVGDPGRAYLPPTGFTAEAAYEVPVSEELENAATKRTTIWRLTP